MLLLTVGPFALPLDRVLMLSSVVVALIVGWLFGRRHQISVESIIIQMLLFGMLSARVAFVLLYQSDYLAEPLSVLDIRDGGFLFGPGVAVASGVGALHFWLNPAICRPLAAAVVAGVATLVISFGVLDQMRGAQSTVPDLTLATLDNKMQPLKGFSGRPIVLNLWASWCPPCRREMPVLAAAQQRETDMDFVFVNQGESAEAVTSYLEREQLQLRNVLLDGHMKLSQHLDAFGMPTTLFFDENGNLVDTHMGELSTATLKRRLEQFNGNGS